MCYRVEVKSDIKKIAKRYSAVVDNPADLLFNEDLNGFTYAKSPLILCSQPEVIATNYSWGLIPHWAADDSIRKNTLNAKLETLDEKPAFRDVTANRCLMIVTGFFEWRWLDDKGKRKQKYRICSSEDELFSLGGLYSSWHDPATGQEHHTFTVVTTDANKEMQFIHNTKKRMPLILNPNDELEWLDPRREPEEFGFPNYKPNIIAFAV
ncbi:MAG: SOS response-associated peptidase [Flavobacterium sp.]|nr:SOS response-associated peptidase [Flavobacterium sp.]